MDKPIQYSRSHNLLYNVCGLVSILLMLLRLKYKLQRAGKIDVVLILRWDFRGLESWVVSSTLNLWELTLSWFCLSAAYRAWDPLDLHLRLAVMMLWARYILICEQHFWHNWSWEFSWVTCRARIHRWLVFRWTSFTFYASGVSLAAKLFQNYH